MASTRHYTRRQLEEASRQLLAGVSDSPRALLSDWEAVRARFQTEGLPVPPERTEADLLKLLRDTDLGSADTSEQDGVVVEFWTDGAAEYEALEEYDVVSGSDPPYHDAWPVLAVNADTGEIKARIPRELAPYVKLRVRMGKEVKDFHGTVRTFRGVKTPRGGRLVLATVLPEIARALLARRRSQ